MSAIALRTEALTRTFGDGRRFLVARKRALQALCGVDLAVAPGEALGLVGESGCGKSTLARLLVGLDRPTSGHVWLYGTDVAGLARRHPRELARRAQYVFQDPAASLNPRKRVSQILAAPLIHLHGLTPLERGARTRELLAAVGLDEGLLVRFPHELSGGQAQRIAIARALAAEPELLVLDEPVSALDVSVQAQILALLRDLTSRLGLTMVFISHDLAVVESLCDRVAVMYGGRIVEQGPVESIYCKPRHPYTDLLSRCVPVPGERCLQPEEEPAELPDPYALPPGCAFAARCPRVEDRCRGEVPVLVGDGRSVACFHPLE